MKIIKRFKFIYNKWSPTHKIFFWLASISIIIGLIFGIYPLISTSVDIANPDINYQKIEEMQNRLSVKPLLSFHRISGHYQPTNGIRLHNDGLGPAQIDSMKVFYKCELSNDWQKLSEKIITDNFIFAPPGTPIETNTPFKGGAYLKEGDSIWIISIPYETLTDHKKYWDYLSNFSITLYYQSILGYRDSIKYGDECS